MKSVLISIQPKWCEKIASGEKTIEVRKSRPNLETPFKCYIYCTYGKTNENYMLGKRGKVIGEFICNETEKFIVGSLRSDDIEKLACVSYSEMIYYFYKPEELDGKTAKQSFAWHISDLKIYDKPKELREFKRIIDKCVFYKDGVCQDRKQNQVILCKNLDCDCKKIVRQPQSWCYIES